MKKTHHPGYWTLSIFGEWSLSLLSTWGMFLSTRKSSPARHVALWSITQAGSWSLTPSYPLIISHTESSRYRSGRVNATEWLFVSLKDRGAAVSVLTCVVLLATDGTMIQMKLIRADNKEKTSSRPFTPLWVSSKEADVRERYGRWERSSGKSLPWSSVTH